LISNQKVVIDKETCKGCELCVEHCPQDALQMDKEDINSKGFFVASLVDEEKCNSCTFCAVMCPDMAIRVYTSR